MINIAEILKDCPKGTKLYSTICGDCTFEKIHLNTSIVVCTQDCRTITFNVYGQYFRDFFNNAECLLFPSKDNRDWNTFQKPFEDGDIISSGSYIAIFHKFGKPKSCEYDKVIYYHCWCYQNGKEFKFKKDFGIGRDTEYKFATDKEKQKLFDIIKANGYKWNSETKTLEKMIVPKFKVGDKIVKKDDPTKSWYVQGIDTYCNSDYYSIITQGQVSNLHFKDQDEWVLLVPTHKFKIGDKVKHIHTGVYCHIKGYSYELKGHYTSIGHFIKDDNVDEWEIVPNKFDISTLKAYDKVLVRDCNDLIWVNALFGFYDTSNEKYPFVASVSKWAQCIPYAGNEHLLGTNNDCDEYYKNW